MNQNLKLDLNMESLKAIAPVLVKALPTVVGLGLIALFGYTAYELNKDINVQPATSQSTLAPLPKIDFYPTVITSLQQRQSVDGSVPVDLGTTNPFE